MTILENQIYLCPRCETNQERGYVCPRCSERLLFVAEGSVGSAIDKYRNSGMNFLSDLIVTEKIFLESCQELNPAQSTKTSSRNRFLLKVSLITLFIGIGLSLAKPYIKYVLVTINSDQQKLTKSERAVYNLYAQQVIAISPEEVNRGLAPEKQMTKIRQKAVFEDTEKKIIGQVVNWNLAITEIKKINDFEAKIETVIGVVDYRDGYEKMINEASDIVGMLSGASNGIVGRPYFQPKYSNQAVGTSITLTIRSPDDWIFLEKLKPGNVINIQGKISYLADNKLVEIEPAVLHSPENLAWHEQILKKISSPSKLQAK